ncbi:MAG: laminin B domain-containing protein [Phycisphaerae bacterium]
MQGRSAAFTLSLVAGLAASFSVGGCPPDEVMDPNNTNTNTSNGNDNGSANSNENSANGRSLPVPVTSKFETSDDGWRLDGGAFQAPTAPTWNQGMQLVTTSRPNFGYWVAPAKFRGNFSGAYGRSLQYDAAWENHCCSNEPRVVLGGGGVTIVHNPQYTPRPQGASFFVRLDETESWYDTATEQRATGDQIRRVLSNLTTLKILAGTGAYSWIDNVSLGEPTKPALALPVRSTFDASNESWQIGGGAFGVLTNPNFEAASGYLSASSAGFAFWTSPEKFTGDFEAAYGRRITFDIAWESYCCSDIATLVLYGGGYEIYWSASQIERTFTNVGVLLDTAESWTISTDDGGRRPTETEMRDLLRNLQRVSIKTGNGGLSRLDNVEFGID